MPIVLLLKPLQPNRDVVQFERFSGLAHQSGLRGPVAAAPGLARIATPKPGFFLREPETKDLGPLRWAFFASLQETSPSPGQGR